MTKVTRLTLEQGGGLERRRLHLREISSDADTPLETVGQDIRAARQRKGEDLASVSKALKIRKDHLEALEEGNLHVLPGRTYAIGFLRSYAEYLGLDAAKYVERFKIEIAGRDEANTPVPNLPIHEERRLPQGSLVFLVLLLIAVVYGGYYLSVSAKRMLSETVAPVPERLAEEAGLETNKANDMPSATQTPAPAVQTVRAPPPAAEPPVRLARETASPSPAAPDRPAVRAPEQTDEAAGGRVYGLQNTNSRVLLRVNRVTRVVVQGPDEMVYINRTLRPGDVYRVPNLEGLTLTTADGGAVEIELDGNPVGMAGEEGLTTEGMPLDPESIIEHNGGAHSG